MKSIIVIIAIFVVACTPYLKDIKKNNNEAIVFFKANVMNLNTTKIDNCRFIFKQSLWEGTVVTAEENDYFYFKIDTGFYNLTRIHYDGHTAKLPDSTFEFNVPESGIFYLGFITFILDFNIQMGEIVDALRSSDKTIMKIENQYDIDTKYFNDMFKNNETIKELKIYSNIKDTTIFNSYIDSILRVEEFLKYKNSLKPNEKGELIDSTGRKINPKFKVRK